MIKFISNAQGGVGIMAALMLPVIAVASLISIEYANAVRAKSALQSVLDATVVGCAVHYESIDKDNFSWEECSRTKFQEFSEHEVGGINLSSIEWVEIDGEIIEANAEAEVSSMTANIFNLDDFTIKTSSRAVIRRAAKIEIALALDVSYSMRGQPFEAMKSAALSFVNTLYDETDDGTEVSVSIIPFGGNVRYPPAYEAWLHPDFMNPGDQAVNPFHSDFEDQIAGCEAGLHRWSFDYSCRLLDEWNGCFHPGPDAEIIDSAVMTSSYREPPLDIVGAFGGDVQPACPSASAQSLFLASDRDALIARINGLTQTLSVDNTSSLSIGTSTDVAVGLASRLLNPGNRGKFFESDELPRDFDATVRKHLVFLTDGQPFSVFTRSEYLPASGTANTETICESIKANNALNTDETINMWTIAYNVSGFENELKECATAGGGFYDAAVDDVEAVFEAIATQITSIQAYLAG